MVALPFREILATESERFRDVLRRVPLDARVPSCPDWSVADLAWHLAEVQYFWAAIVSGLLAEPDVEDPERPPGERLLAWGEEQSAALLAALASRSPGDTCWSWHEQGGTVGWTARRQAHEALIHRVDAELAAGSPITGVDTALAADGLDEVLAFHVTWVPSWGKFYGDGVVVAVRATDAGAEHMLEFGRFAGTSPHSGRTYDQPTTRLVQTASPAGATISGPAWDLDLWLWGRAGDGGLAVTGEAALAERLRAVAAGQTV